MRVEPRAAVGGCDSEGSELLPPLRLYSPRPLQPPIQHSAHKNLVAIRVKQIDCRPQRTARALAYLGHGCADGHAGTALHSNNARTLSRAETA